MSFVIPSLRARSGRRPGLCQEHTNTALGVANAACTSSDELDPHRSLQQLFVRVWSRTHVKKATLNISHDRPSAGHCCFLRFGGTYVGITRCIFWDFCMRRMRLRHHAAAHDHRHSSTDFQAMRGRMRMCTRDATDAATAFKLQAQQSAIAGKGKLHVIASFTRPRTPPYMDWDSLNLKCWFLQPFFDASDANSSELNTTSCSKLNVVEHGWPAELCRSCVFQ